MSCELLDGKKVAHEWKCKLKSLIEFHMKEDPTVRTPKLVIFHNGNDDASKVYMKNKVKACTEVGINCEIIEVNHRVFQIPDNADGAILQLPVENDTIKDVFLKKVYPTNDVDGLSIYSKGHLFNGTKYNIENFEDNTFYNIPCTPMGIMNLLKEYNIELEGKHVVIVGRSELVGKPLAMLMLNKNATVTICHSKTVHLDKIMQNADIVVTAIGKANYFDYTYFKKDAILIDVSINRDENGKLCGDVNTDKLDDILSYRTPVPGGVGPLTVVSLLWNTYFSWRYNFFGY